MSEVEQVFWVLVALTVAFGTVWVRPGGTLLVSQAGERHRPRWLAGRALVRNGDGGVLLGNLLPVGSSFVAAPWPLSVSPVGVLAFSPTAPTPDGRPNETGAFVAFADLRTAAADGRTLVLNGRPFVTAQSSSAATRWARWLGELKELPEAKRGSWIEAALAASCDVNAARAVIEDGRRRARWVRRLSTVVFAYAFLTLGLAAFAGLAVSLRPGLAVYLWLVALTYLATLRALRANGVAAGSAWMILVSPVDAFRAAEKVVRPPLEVFHPLVLTHLLATPAAHAEFARRVVRDVRYPLPGAVPTGDGRAGDALRWFAERQRAAVERLVRATNIDPDPFTAPPRPDDDRTLGYCPRCGGQFVRASGPCSACGVEVRPFPAQAGGCS